MVLEELPYWLALGRMRGIGPAHIRQILDQGFSMQTFFELSGSELQALGLKPQQSEQIKAFHAGHNSEITVGVERDLAWCASSDQHSILTFASDDYPALLREIPAAPPVLFVRGDVNCLSLPQIAVVGTRHPSRQGKQLAHDFAAFFAQQGFVLTSGLALGIDACAHEGALNASGQSVAVLAHGLDAIYPARNQALGQRLVGHGALVSEFPIGVNPRPEYFPRRNRIISGLSLGVLVVQAAVKSGSLITAKVAAEQGREVFALPGSIHDPLAKGCHELIRNGATLVETAAQVVEELNPLLGYLQSSLPLEPSAVVDRMNFEPSSTEAKLLSVMDFDPTSVDQLVGLTGLSVADVSSALVLLELEGAIAQSRGGYMRT